MWGQTDGRWIRPGIQFISGFTIGGWGRKIQTTECEAKKRTVRNEVRPDTSSLSDDPDKSLSLSSISRYSRNVLFPPGTCPVAADQGLGAVLGKAIENTA